jgi:hypothetical protein
MGGEPAKNVPQTVPVDELEELSESEVVNMHFRLEKLRVEDVEDEVKKLLGPKVSVTCLTKTNELSITATVGQLRTMCDLLRINWQKHPAPVLRFFRFKNIRAEDALPRVCQSMGIPEGKNAAADSSIRIGAYNDRLFISGQPDKVICAQCVAAKLDADSEQAGRTKNH